MDGASFDFDDFIFETGDAEVVQSSAGTSTTVGATEAARTSGGAPSGSRSDSHPPQLSRGDLIPVIYSLKTHAWILHCLLISSCLLSLLLAFLSYCIYRIALAIVLV